VRLVDAAAIDWLEAANQYLRVQAGTRSYLIRASLSDLEQRLPPELFLRIHRSSIVNLGRIEELHGTSAADRWVVLKGVERLKVSSPRWPQLRDSLVGPA